MRLVALERIEDGAELARDVVGGRPGGPPLLRAGVRIARATAERAAANGVAGVWIEDELGEDIEPPEPLPGTIRDAALRAIARAHDAARRAISAGKPLEQAVLRELGAAAAAIADVVGTRACDPADPAPADPQRHWHALRVATLGLAIGGPHLRAVAAAEPNRARGDRIAERLAMLGTGLLAHDLGKVGLPEALLARTSPASTEEQAILDRHTVLGESMMAAAAVPVQVRSAIRGHHEHWDGSGRPDRKAGVAIHVSARIAAVADAYDALTTARPYRRALAPHAAVRAIEDAAGTRFDPQVVGVFSALVMPYPVGHEIALPDGRHGVVAGVEPERRMAPTVRARRAGGGIEQFELALSPAGDPALVAS